MGHVRAVLPTEDPAVRDVPMQVRDRLRDLGLTLPAAPAMPVTTTFIWVRVLGDRVFVSGHGPQQPDGTPARPSGRVPNVVSLEQAQQSARPAALAVIASVEQAVGDLDRIDAWLTVTGFVQAEAGYPKTTAVLNSFSELVLDVFGPACCTGTSHPTRWVKVVCTGASLAPVLLMLMAVATAGKAPWRGRRRTRRGWRTASRRGRSGSTGLPPATGPEPHRDGLLARVRHAWPWFVVPEKRPGGVSPPPRPPPAR